MFRIALVSGIILLMTSLAWAADTEGESKIWSGVFTTAQAERGKAHYEKNCSNCHNTDMSGSVRAPSIRGDHFMQNWQNGSVDVLFVKLRDSMPATYPDAVPEDVKIDILAYLLQQNGFPTGPKELKLDQKELADIQIASKGGQATANFTLVRTVGCLTQVPGKPWTLTKASEPSVTRDEIANAAALKVATDIPFGTQRFELMSTAAFKPESRNGQKVEARGLLYREANRSMMTLTSLESIGSACE